MIWHDPTTAQLIDLALAEDVGTGDVTTLGCVPPEATARARVVAKEGLVLAGTAVFTAVFARVDPAVRVELAAQDGEPLEPGREALRLAGSARSLLVGERTALNFLQRLSGIATLTRQMAEALAPFPGTRLIDTRKTTPGWRSLEKAAVVAGGGRNHRHGLFDGVLIKDNHIAAAGGVGQAIEAAHKTAHHLLKIECEVTDFEELAQALAAGVDGVLLDNMDDATLAEAVRLVKAHEAATGRRVFTEASGNMSLARLPKVGEAGVDLVSVGALTHSARAMDLSMKLELAS
jgi:nicotinate-nucleotide pyrophosphorylase (carboxylating)